MDRESNGKMHRWCTFELGAGPIVATALHDGHAIRPEVAELLALDDKQRLREEDPHTGGWTTIVPSRVVARRSRFELDLNRPREKAVYQHPEDAWGLQLWQVPLPASVVNRSLEHYDAFYDQMFSLLSDLEQRYGSFVVLDLHTFNHRRGGPRGPRADPQQHPEINVGTGTMERRRWQRLVERFLNDLRSFDYLGRELDVRENVCFRGGHFPGWIHRTFPETGCALAVEVKKFFMDEWTGQVDERQLEAVRRALQATIPGILEELERRAAEQSHLPRP